MFGNKLSYVALIVKDVESEAARLQQDFGLTRLDHDLDSRKVPVLAVGESALALFAKGDPYTGGTERTGVHHIALGVDDPTSAAEDLKKAGMKIEDSDREEALGGVSRYLLPLEQTNGLRTYVSGHIEVPEKNDGFIQRIDHLGVVGTDNPLAIRTYCDLLGCELTGEQFDTELQTFTEHFVYKATGGTYNVVHTRPSQFVASVHDLFIRTGDCELEIIQPLKTAAVHKPSGERAGDTQQDHGAIWRFLERNGPGLHHIAFKVADIDKQLGVLADRGYDLIDTRGRPGARCSRIGFIHPRSTNGVLMHYVERDDQLGQRE